MLFDADGNVRFVQSALPHLTPYRVQKTMRELGIHGIAPKAKKRATVPDEDAPARPDLVRRDFTSPVPTYKPVGDITYLRTGQGLPYLAAVMDPNTRMAVGWSLSEHMYAEGRSCRTRGDARACVVEFVEAFYNRKRPHSSIGYQIPAACMQAFFGRARDAFAEEAEANDVAASGSGRKAVQAA
ncbi:MAG: hypothetical protein IJ131_01080 [Eggerthellaceae bacterium]|nr:hypothetical protein [Eggerthellaceae bacterium]